MQCAGVGVLATYAYDNLGRRASLTRGNGATTSYSFDGASRLTQMVDNLSGATHDQTIAFTYNPAGQIASRSSGNNLYAYLSHFNIDAATLINGLNQATSVGGASTSHDARGNLTAYAGKSYAYDAENFMTSGDGATLEYEAAGRLHRVTKSGFATTRFVYAGSAMIAEHDASGGAVLRRYVHGASVDEVIVWYEGAGTSDRRFLIPDERGSIVAVANSSGVVTNVNTYDAYGKPAASNVGRFQFTGQLWIAEVGLYYYKARFYHPGLGRFMQTDPIGYGDGMNMYAYVGGDPVNSADPSGMRTACVQIDNGERICYTVHDPSYLLWLERTGGSGRGYGGGGGVGDFNPFGKDGNGRTCSNLSDGELSPGENGTVIATYDRSNFNMTSGLSRGQQSAVNRENGNTARDLIADSLKGRNAQSTVTNEVRFNLGPLFAVVDIVYSEFGTAKAMNAFSLIEVKFGSGRLSINQGIVYPAINVTSPAGRNALLAGFRLDKTVGQQTMNPPARVQVFNVLPTCD